MRIFFIILIVAIVFVIPQRGVAMDPSVGMCFIDGYNLINNWLDKKIPFLTKKIRHDIKIERNPNRKNAENEYYTRRWNACFLEAAKMAKEYENLWDDSATTFSGRDKHVYFYWRMGGGDRGGDVNVHSIQQLRGIPTRGNVLYSKDGALISHM